MVGRVSRKVLLWPKFNSIITYSLQKIPVFLYYIKNNLILKAALFCGKLYLILPIRKSDLYRLPVAENCLSKGVFWHAEGSVVVFRGNDVTSEVNTETQLVLNGECPCGVSKFTCTRISLSPIVGCCRHNYRILSVCNRTREILWRSHQCTVVE